MYLFSGKYAINLTYFGVIKFNIYFWFEIELKYANTTGIKFNEK